MTTKTMGKHGKLWKQLWKTPGKQGKTMANYGKIWEPSGKARENNGTNYGKDLVCGGALGRRTWSNAMSAVITNAAGCREESG